MTHLLAGLAAPWCVVGGWSLDLFLGRVTREHSDVDVALLRDDQLAVREHLSEWDIQVCIGGGHLQPWRLDMLLPPPLHELHATNDAATPSHLELLLNERSDDAWVYRRDRRITLPLDEWIMRSDAGVPYQAPQVTLLYKSKRPYDEAERRDFETVLPSLNTKRRRWLLDALRTADAANPWIERLAGGGV